MANPYSTSFLQLAGLDGTRSIVVPPASVFILRCLDVYCSTGLSTAHLRLLGAAGQTVWMAQCDTDTSVHAQWEGRQVFEPGQSFEVATDAPWDVTLSGYNLSLTPAVRLARLRGDSTS